MYIRQAPLPGTMSWVLRRICREWICPFRVGCGIHKCIPYQSLLYRANSQQRCQEFLNIIGSLVCRDFIALSQRLCQGLFCLRRFQQIPQIATAFIQRHHSGKLQCGSSHRNHHPTARYVAKEKSFVSCQRFPSRSSTL